MRRDDKEDQRLLGEMLTTAEDFCAYGVISKTDLAKMRAICMQPPTYSPERVMAIRTKVAKMSQSVFASFLNVSVSTIQKWESPTANKHPGGAAAKLLFLLEKKGVDALMSW